MYEKLTQRLRLYLVAFVALWEVAHLVWEHLNGGIVSHHFLAMKEMPAISNWWGLLLLPTLAWVLAGNIQKRINSQPNGKDAKSRVLASIVIGGVASLIFGILLSFFFTNGNEDVTSYLFFGMILLSFILPIFRAECLLGFVLGMTFTFGAVLPTFIGSIVAALSAIVHLLIFPGLRRIWIWSTQKK
jgi:hypothetical protein